MVFSPFPSPTAMQSSGAAGTMVNMAPPRAPFWQEQGWPSEAAWKVAGSPAEAYAAYVAKSQSGAELSAFGSDQPSEFVQAPPGTLLSQLQEQRQGQSVNPIALVTEPVAEFVSDRYEDVQASPPYRAIDSALDFAVDANQRAPRTGTTAVGAGEAATFLAPRSPEELALELTPFGLVGDVRRGVGGAVETAGDILQSGTRAAGGVPGYGAGLTPGASDDALSAIAASMREAEETRPLQTEMFTEERAVRRGEGEDVLETLQGEEAFKRARSQMAGEFERPQLGIPQVNDLERSGLFETVRTAPVGFYEKLQAAEALDNLLIGRIPEPARLASLRLIFPSGADELVATIEKQRVVKGLTEPKLGAAEQALPPTQPSLMPEPAVEGFQPSFLEGQTDFAGITPPPRGASLKQLELEQAARSIGEFVPPSMNPDAPGMSFFDQVEQLRLGPVMNPGAYPSGTPIPQEVKDALLTVKARQLKENERLAREGHINFNFLNEVAGFIGSMRSIMASLDLPIFRQGQGLGWAHPVIWKDAALAGLRAAKGDNAFFTRAAIESSPVYSIKSGPYEGMGFTDPDIGGKIYDWGATVIDQSERVPGFTGINESYIGRLTGTKNPMARLSERTHATVLNVQGIQAYEKYFQTAVDRGLRGKELKEELRRVAQVINHARGYGSANPGKIIPAIDVFFSGRNLVSVFDRLLDPLINVRHPMARNLAAKNLALYAAGHAALLGFLGITGAYAGGAWSVEMDPYSSDFGKVRVGNTSFDTTGGMAPTLRLIYRMAAEGADATGITDNSYRGQGWRTELINFFRNKESPAAAKVTEILTESDWMGRPQSAGESLSPENLAAMWFPFITGEVYDAYTQNPAYSPASATSIAALAGGLGFLGISSQTYRRAREEVNTKLQQEIAEGMWQSTFTDEDGNLQPVQTFNDLEAASPEAAELFRTQNKPLFDFLAESQSNKAREQKELQEEFYKNQLERDKEMGENPEKWRLDSSDQAGKLTAYLHQLWKDEDFDAEPDSKLDRVQNEYHEQIELNTVNGVVDWDEVDKWMAMLDEESQRLLFESRLEWETPARQQYIKDIEKLIPYWDIKDKVFREATRNDAMFNQFDSANDAVLAITNQLMDQLGLSRDEAKQEAQSMLDIYMDISRDISYDYLGENPELIPLLDKYGYDVPNIFQDLAR